ncbi:RhuM family protein [Corynebacterium durum]|uniref:virulence RhuM family protein n=1 Tax=Corynebacterium durum TaxID=61592 RepID=UPI0028ECA842|nr:RhuM family protein [Corynebacterium durum]
MSENGTEKSIIIYQPVEGQAGIDVRVESETVWLSQRQMGELFDVDVRTISEHLSNVFSSGELEKEATIRKFRIVRREGLRDVTRNVEHYNLDAIISVGYRVNSITITQFRIWATKRLPAPHFSTTTVTFPEMRSIAASIRILLPKSPT